MSEVDLVQRVDSAEMADLFSSAFLVEDDDFLSPTNQSLTHDDVRHLRLDPKNDSRRSLPPVRVGDPMSELHLRATGEEDAWLVRSPSAEVRQLTAARSDSVDAYLNLQDAQRPSFKRSAGVTTVTDRHARASGNGFAKQAGCKEPQREPLSGRRSANERRPGDRSSSGAAYDRCPSAGGRRKQTPSPALTNRSSLEGRDPLVSRGSSSCATPTSAIDPPYSPCSSSSRIPTPKNGRSRLPSPTLSDCRSNVSSPAQSDPHSRFSSPTPSERSLRQGGPDAVARPHSAVGYGDSRKAPSSVCKTGHRGQKSWSAGLGSDCDPFSPKSSVSDYGSVSLSDEFGQRGPPYYEGEENRGIPKQKLFKGGLSKLQKQMRAAQEAAKKGTKLKPKQEAARGMLWKAS